ncbi:MAG: DMT family transporter [Roseiflexaceae bacterium]
MGILFGLTAAICWGVADFVVTRIARELGVAQAFFYVQMLGMGLIGLLLLASPALPAPTARMWLLVVGIGLFNLAGTLLLYRSFAIGTLALVSPIASAFAVVSALLALLAGERPALLALLGALVLVGGIVIVSRAQHENEGQKTKDDSSSSIRPSSSSFRRLPPGVPEAIGVALCFGISFWALGFVTPALGILWPVLVLRIVEAIAVVLFLLRQRTAPARLTRSMAALVLAAATLDTLAYVAFNLGIGSSYTSIVTALASLFSAVTVLLAWVILRERLAPAQWVGVAVILAGVLLVSL